MNDIKRDFLEYSQMKDVGTAESALSSFRGQDVCKLWQTAFKQVRERCRSPPVGFALAAPHNFG